MDGPRYRTWSTNGKPRRENSHAPPASRPHRPSSGGTAKAGSSAVYPFSVVRDRCRPAASVSLSGLPAAFHPLLCRPMAAMLHGMCQERTRPVVRYTGLVNLREKAALGGNRAKQLIIRRLWRSVRRVACTEPPIANSGHSSENHGWGFVADVEKSVPSSDAERRDLPATTPANNPIPKAAEIPGLSVGGKTWTRIMPKTTPRPRNKNRRFDSAQRKSF